MFPFAKPYTGNFLFIQNVDATTGLAGIGLNDTFIVVYWIVVLTFIRSVFASYILRALAIQCGLTTAKNINRFVEQGWSIVYYSASFIIGMLLFRESDYWMSAQNLWVGWPHYQIPVLIKAYYMIQLASWFQQIYVLHVEARRKDHVQMFTHHIVTCILMIGSYYYYYTRVGHVILILMDSVDSQLSLAKIFNYLGMSAWCDGVFMVFMVNWVICRHGFYNYLVWTAMKAPEVISLDCYYDANGDLVRCFTPAVHWTLVILLGILQVITLVWFYMIVRIAYRVVKGTASANDTRSDHDDSEDEGEDEHGDEPEDEKVK